MEVMLYHYSEADKFCLRSIMDLSFAEAFQILEEKRKKYPKNVSPQVKVFLEKRIERERQMREKFINIGGKPTRKTPIYFFVGACEEYLKFYVNPRVILIPLKEFNPKHISFTYGDSMPIFSPELNDGREFWQNVFSYEQITNLVKKYGLPSSHAVYENSEGGSHKRALKCIEAQVWDNEIIEKYKRLN
jgi:hypothetical protein